jgi:hypothetical protein
MKTASKILVVVVVLGLLLLGGYAIYRYLLPRWIPILFYTYAGLGFAISIYGISRMILQSGRSGSLRDDIPAIIRIMTEKSDLSTRIRQIRNWTEILLREIADVILWPIALLSNLLLIRKSPSMGTQELAVRQTLHLSEHYYSLFSLTVTLAVFGLGFRGMDLKRYGAIALSLVLIAISLRHARYSIQTTPLPAVFRRLSANPYFAFLALIAADFSTMVLALTALRAPGNFSSVTLDHLHSTANQLLQAQEPLKLLRGGSLTEQQVIVGVIGLLFYLALFKTLTEYKEFRRQHEDYIWLASASNSLGNFSAALRHLRKVGSWNDQAHGAEIVALIGVNEIDKAAAKVRLFLENSHKDLSPEQIYASMWSACLLAPLADDTMLTLFQYSVTLNVRDAFMQDSLVGTEGNRSLQKKALDVFLPVKDKYPLTAAKLLFLLDDSAGALALLKEAPSPILLDEVIKLVLQLTINISEPNNSSEDNAKIFQDWWPLANAKLHELMKITGVPWERIGAYAQFLSIRVIASEIAPDRVDVLTYLCDSFKEETQGEEALRGFSVAELRIQKIGASA